MSRVFRKRLTGVLAVVTALAVPGGVAAILATSGGGATSVLAATAGWTPTAGPTAGPTAAGGSSRPAPVPASPTPAADPAPASPAPATPATEVRALPKVVEKPPPVVGGVRRINVGSDHSPRIQQQLSSRAVVPPPADAGARGVDVADYQHPHGAAIAWPRVAGAGFKFAFIKATEGDYYANPYYASDLAQAKAAGLYATGYHFAVPNVSGGASQADYAVRHGAYAADGRTLPLALDIEYNPYGAECYGLSHARMVSWVSAFTAEVRRLTGQRPIIYSTADWWNTCTGGSTAFGSDPLWVAAYGSEGPPMPAGWHNWTFWQYTSLGSVPGITGNVDVSYFLRAAVRLLDPGNQRTAPGTAVRLQVRSLNAAAGQPPHFTASHLPPGLSVNGSGLITGTVARTASGRYGVTVTATYPGGDAGSVSFTWTVTSSRPSPPPSRSPSPSPSASHSPSPSPSPSSSPPPSDPSSSPPPSTGTPSPSTETPSPSTEPPSTQPPSTG